MTTEFGSSPPEGKFLNKFANLREDWTNIAKIACHQDCESADSCCCTQTFVHVDELVRWMKRSDTGDSNQSTDNTSNAVGTSNAVRLLLELHDRTKSHRNFPFLVDSGKILDGEDSCLRVFAILLQQGYGEFIEVFQHAGINDNSLKYPITGNARQRLLEKRFPKPEIAEFERLKWAYLSPKLTLHMHGPFEEHNMIMPFCRRKPVNDKGGTARVYHVAVKQCLVSDPELRKVLARSLYEDPKFGPVRSSTLLSQVQTDN